MSLSKFIFSRKFLNHLMLAALVFFIFLLLTMQGLKIYTRHGQSNPVPDFYGLTPEEAMVRANQHKLKIKVTDSIFFDDALPGVIVDQLPKAGHGVKENRTISVTLNSTQPEMVTLPKLTDISFRQAQALIENSGLSPGNISYQPSEYNDLVLEAKVGTEQLKPGEKVTKGTKIDLTVGRTYGGKVVSLPELTGLTIEEAMLTLANSMLNTGVIIFDESILTSQDSVDARVYRQSPAILETTIVPQGSSVDIWLTADQSKFQENL